MKLAIVIPARLHSTRLPKKLIQDLAGKSVLERTYEQCLKTNLSVYLAVDDELLVQHCKGFTTDDRIILTQKDHESGTDRIQEANQIIQADAIINVQGDEPFISSELILAIAKELEKGKSMVSAMNQIEKVNDYLDPNKVKVVVDANYRALYFSRSPIPYDRGQFLQLKKQENLPSDLVCYKHVGLYGYSSSVLNRFPSFPSSPLERTEKLEQLRCLENGIDIQMVLTKHESLGIDTIEDLEKAFLSLKL